MPEKDTHTQTALTVTTGVVNRARRFGLYGPEGIGKTTLAAQFPQPVFIDTEGGTEHMDVARFPRPRSWADIVAIVDFLRTQAHGYCTLVIDTVDWLERLAATDICDKHRKDSVESFGYGKGWTILGELVAEFLAKLEALRDRGMHIVLVAHSTIKKFEQPDQSGSYDRYELKLSKTVSPLVKEWLDALIFINYETKVVELDGKKKAVGGRERVMYTSHTAAWDAKNRHGFAEKLPFAFAALDGAFQAAAPAKPSAPAPATAVAPAAPAKPATDQQVKNLQSLWQQLGCGQEQMEKLFQWLDAEALKGAENWTDLTQEQAARAIGFLAKKLGGAA
jgi:GTPase SAR1 family protein